MPGMKIRSIDKVCILVSSEGEPIYRDGYGVLTSVPYAEPDLTDPATLGCLMALVREAWKDEGIAVIASYDYESGYQWRVIEGHHHGSKWQTMSQKRFPTEDEALVAALEAAE
jgi:hypothetical protein